jgi:hypothetical protein
VPGKIEKGEESSEVGANVYANGNAIACKAGDGKVIASFPDVCLSPPSPPAGPLPVPYPNTSFSKDLQNGSKTVKIKSKELALKDQSFYKSSPLGNEAATRSFGGSPISHVITGKTYFQAWSMDVKVEGMNVGRHTDAMTSNHGSFQGTSLSADLEDAVVAMWREGLCPCCERPRHSESEPMNGEQWYLQNNPGREDEVRELLRDAERRAGCRCKQKSTKHKKNQQVTPDPPCNLFFVTTPQERAAINAGWDPPDGRSDSFKKKYGVPKNQDQLASLPRTPGKKSTAPQPTARQAERFQEDRQVNHLTPRVAGGCPGGGPKDKGDRNLQIMNDLCEKCRDIDRRFQEFQNL